MPVLIPKIPFIRRRVERVETASPPAGPVVTHATFSADDQPTVMLTFDQPVVIAGGTFDGTSVVVNDPTTGGTYQSNDGIDINVTTVMLTFDATGDPSHGSQTTLNAGAGTGIVSAVGGVAWAGAVNLVLPFH